MSKTQEYMVSWTGRDDHERYSTFDTLEEAQEYFEKLKTREYDHYVYLSVVIAQSQLLYRVHWCTVGTIKPTKPIEATQDET